MVRTELIHDNMILAKTTYTQHASWLLKTVAAEDGTDLIHDMNNMLFKISFNSEIQTRQMNILDAEETDSSKCASFLLLIISKTTKTKG